VKERKVKKRTARRKGLTWLVPQADGGTDNEGKEMKNSNNPPGGAGVKRRKWKKGKPQARK